MWAVQSTAIGGHLIQLKQTHTAGRNQRVVDWNEKSQNSVIHEFWSTQNEMHGCCNCLPLDLIVDPQQKHIIKGRVSFMLVFVQCFEIIQIYPGVLSDSRMMILSVLMARRRHRLTITPHIFLKNGSSTCKLKRGKKSHRLNPLTRSATPHCSCSNCSNY